MMVSLFSVFDPSSGLSGTPHNMLSVFFFFFLPVLVWYKRSNIYKWAFNSVIGFILKELAPFGKKFPHMILFTSAIFIFVSTINFSGNFAYVFPASTHISLSGSLGLSVWLVFLLQGVLNNCSSRLSHLAPKGTPYVLIPLMVIIELISLLVRPLTLAVRLSANMVAGHLLVALMSEAYLNSPFYMHSSIANYLNPLVGLELAIAVVQGYVFSVLVSLYAEECDS